MKLKNFQDRFQRAILVGDDAILEDIPDGPRETKRNLLGVYRDAYALRLIEVIGNDHELLKAYLGEDGFREMARAYIGSFPSDHPNARYFARRLPEFLQTHEPYSRHSALADLAGLERALNDAFDGPDAPVVGLAGLAGIAPDAWAALRFTFHPTARELAVATNVVEIWTALKAKIDPPASVTGEGGRQILVWRQELTARLRELPPEEAMMVAEARRGVRFGDLCALLATYADADTAPARAAGYLSGWLDAGLLSSATTA